MSYMLPLANMQQAAPPHQSSSGKPQHHHQQVMRTVSISILVMSLPVLYVSFLHVPPAALFRDTTFWFLMSNSIIIVIAADSGMLFCFGSSSSSCASVDVVSGGEPVAAVKNDDHHFADEVVVPLPVEENLQVTVRTMREEQEHVTTTMVADNDDDHALYALVLRDDGQAQRRVEINSEPDQSRDIMVVSPPPSDLAVVATAAVPVPVPVWNEGTMVRANRTPLIQLKASSRSLAREERSLRRRHSHRPSSHSRALVPVQDKSVVLVSSTEEEKKQRQLRRSATTTAAEGRPSAAEEMEMENEKEKESEYSRLSNEELNRRVEEFITKFNREMRLQLEREQQLALAAA